MHACTHVCLWWTYLTFVLVFRRNLILDPDCHAKRFGCLHYLPSYSAVLCSVAESSSALRVRDMNFQEINCFMVVLERICRVLGDVDHYLIQSQVCAMTYRVFLVCAEIGSMVHYLVYVTTYGLFWLFAERCSESCVLWKLRWLFPFYFWKRGGVQWVVNAGQGMSITGGSAD